MSWMGSGIYAEDFDIPNIQCPICQTDLVNAYAHRDDFGRTNIYCEVCDDNFISYAY